MSTAWLHRTGCLTIGSVSCATSIASGAFGSHGLTSLGDSEKKAWASANKYQFLHSLALISLPTLLPKAHTPAFIVTSRLFIFGTILFSGSIYSKVLMMKTTLEPNGGTDEEKDSRTAFARQVGKGAPIGGVALIGGWLAMALLRRRGR